MKISIIGISGGGKTTLAKKISEKLRIPRIELDTLWFAAGGHLLKQESGEERNRVRADMRSRLEPLMRQESWVSDGWYSKAQPIIAKEADQLVFLDIPLWRRLFNHLYRTFFTKRHAHLRKWDDIKYLLEIITRTSKLAAIREFVLQYPEKTVILKSYKEADEYVRNL